MNVGRLNAVLGLDTKEYEQGIKKAQSGAKDISTSLKSIAATAGIAFGVKEIGQFALSASKLAGTFEGVSRAFENLNRSDILDKMRVATMGAVSDLELMQQAVMATNFRIPLDVMAKGLEFATIRAKETGQEIDYLVNSFVVGMGRKSIMILDNLGLSMREIQDETKKLGDFSLAVGAIMERELAKSGKQVMTTTDAYAAFSAEIQNLTVNIGQLINNLLSVKEELQGQESALERLNFYIDFWQDKYGTAAGMIVGEFQKMLYAEQDVEKQQKMLTDETEKYRKKVIDLKDAVAAGDKAAIDQNNTYIRVWSLLSDINLEYDDYKIALEQATEAAKKLRAEEKLLNDIRESSASMLDKAFGDIGFGDITAPATGGMFDWSMIDLPEEALDPEPYIEFADTMKSQAEGLASSMDFYNKQLVNSFVGMAESFGATIGEMIATGEVGFAQFLKIAVDFAKQFGGILIALGIAKNALIPGSGVRQIAAGIALGVAASGVGAYMASKEQQQTMNVNVTGEVSGRNLAIVNQRGGAFQQAVT